MLLVGGTNGLVLGKTCRYCSRCGLIVAHQDQVEAELAAILPTIDPSEVGRPYRVVGTVDRAYWKRSLGDPNPDWAATLEHLADFRERLDLEYDPGGWPRDEG
jgi:hypothetical protein